MAARLSTSLAVKPSFSRHLNTFPSNLEQQAHLSTSLAVKSSFTSPLRPIMMAPVRPA